MAGERGGRRQVAGRELAALAAASLVLGVVLLLYLGWPSAAYTGDGTLYATLVADQAYNPDARHSRFSLHPHHLLYGPLAVAFTRALGPPVADPQAAEILRLSWLSSLLATAALALFFLLLRRASSDTALALATTLVLAVTRSFWSFAVDVEVQALSFLLVVAFLLQVERPEARWGAFRIGLAHGAAVLGHLLNVVLFVPAALALRPPAGAPGRAALAARRALAYLAGTGISAGLPYLLAARALDLASPAAFLAYLLPGGGYLSPPWTGGVRALAGLEGLFVAPPSRGTAGGVLFAAAAAPLAGLVALAIARALRGRLAPGTAPLRRASLRTLGAFVPAWITWDAGNAEFLCFGLPPAAAWLGTALAPAGGRRTSGERAGLVLASAAAFGLFGHHFRADALPRSDPANNRALRRAELVAAGSEPGSVLLHTGEGLAKFYVPYFARRQQIVLEWELARAGSGAAAAAALARELAARRAAGARLYATEDLFDPAHLERSRAAQGFGPAELARALDGLAPVAVFRLEDGFTLFRLEPAAPAPEGRTVP